MGEPGMGRDAKGAKSQEDKKWDPHGGSCGGLLVHLLCQSACSGMPRSHLPSWKLDLPPSSFTQRRRRALEEEEGRRRGKAKVWVHAADLVLACRSSWPSAAPQRRLSFSSLSLPGWRAACPGATNGKRLRRRFACQITDFCSFSSFLVASHFLPHLCYLSSNHLVHAYNTHKHWVNTNTNTNIW